MSAPKLKELFGLARNLKEPQPLVDRDDFVIAAVNDEHGAGNGLEIVSGRKLDTRQPPRGEPRVDLGGHVWNRDEAAFYYERARPVPARCVCCDGSSK